MSLLRDLDEKYVPRLAESLDRALRRLPKPEPKPPPRKAPPKGPRQAGPRPAARPGGLSGARPGGLPARLQGTRPGAGLPADGPAPLVVRLRELDDRHSSRGPLALLRDLPQLGAVVVTALVLAGSIVTYSRRAPEQGRDGVDVTQGADGAGNGTLGPDIGENVPKYVNGSNDRLRRLGVEQPDGMVVAVISFTNYVTPEQAAQLLGHIQARQVFYRPPVPTGLVKAARVGDLVGDTKRVFRQEAALRAAALKELKKVTATIENDPTQKADQERDIVFLTREVRLLRGKCPCVFAAVVRTNLRHLLDALRVNGIRTIDVSEIGADIANLTFTALLPEERVTVTGGNQDLQ